METYIVPGESAEFFIMRKNKLDESFKCRIPNEICK